MANPNTNQRDETAQPDDFTQWGETKIIDGAKCRQCKRCELWFPIGWLAHHGCPLRRQYLLFNPPA